MSKKIDKGMCILGLKTNNFMRLELVELQLNGNDLVIGGANEQGKSSLLNAFWVALQGADAMKDLEITQPVRKGQEKASITLILGPAGECLEMIKADDGSFVAPDSAEVFFVTRKWVGENMYLEVTTKDGAKYPSPQKLLDALVGKMFDPFEFSMLKGSEQKELLLKLVDLGDFDLSDNAYKRKDLYDKRTEVNRDVARLEGALKTLEGTFNGAPQEELSATAILAEKDQAQAIARSNEKERDRLKELTDLWHKEVMAINAIDVTIEDLRLQIAELEATKEKEIATHVLTEKVGRDQNELVKSLIEPELRDYMRELEDIEELNKLFRIQQKYQETEKLLHAEVLRSQDLTKSISECDDAKTKALSSANFPVDGLSFSDSGITFNDIPFSQCSTEEKIRICVSISMALSPRLKVIRISRAESLDAKNFEIIKSMAAAQGYQLLMERVGDPGEMGIIIEDGKVKEGV